MRTTNQIQHTTSSADLSYSVKFSSMNLNFYNEYSALQLLHPAGHPRIFFSNLSMRFTRQNARHTRAPNTADPASIAPPTLDCPFIISWEPTLTRVPPAMALMVAACTGTAPNQAACFMTGLLVSSHRAQVRKTRLRMGIVYLTGSARGDNS